MWSVRFVFAGKKRTFRKDLELETLIDTPKESLFVSNSSPKAAIYEAQRQVKDKVIEIIKNSPLKRASR